MRIYNHYIIFCFVLQKHCANSIGRIAPMDGYSGGYLRGASAPCCFTNLTIRHGWTDRTNSTDGRIFWGLPYPNYHRLSPMNILSQPHGRIHEIHGWYAWSRFNSIGQPSIFLWSEMSQTEINILIHYTFLSFPIRILHTSYSPRTMTEPLNWMRSSLKMQWNFFQGSVCLKLAV